MRPFTWISAAFDFVAPEDRLTAPALPLTLLVRPLPLFALFVLALNDHVLKGSGWLPGALTGKLSDFAGLLYFPLLLVTLLNLAGFAVGKRRVRFASATRRQLVLACVATGAFFAAVQLSSSVAAFYARSAAWLMFWNDAAAVHVTMDPSDCIALLSLPIAYFYGTRCLRRVPPGRLAYALAHRERVRPQDALADVRALTPARARGELDALCQCIEENAAPHTVDAALEAYRATLLR